MSPRDDNPPSAHHRRGRLGGKLSVRFGLTTIDQAISSLSNFAVGIGAARVAGLRGFGAYSLVYSSWLVLAAAHRALVTDPMAINNDLNQPEAATHVRLGLAAELSIGLAAAALCATIGAVLMGVGQGEFGISFLGIAPWLPFLLTQDYWRRTGFMKSRPQDAIVNDIAFDVVQFAAFAALYGIGMRSPLVAVTAWGLGALAGACLGMRQFATAPSLRGGFARIRERWPLSKWLILVDTAGQATAQATPVLTGAFLGPGGIGGLQAASTLVAGPSLVLLQAGGNIGLPEASKALHEHGWTGLQRILRAVTVAGMASVGAVGVVVLLFGRRLLELVYGPGFGRFSHVADILALAYLLGTVSLGAVLSLKVTRQTRRMFQMNVASSVVSIAAITVLAPLYGLTGAAVATLIGVVASSACMLGVHLRYSRKEAIRMATDESATDRSTRPQVAMPAGGTEPDVDFAAALAIDDSRLDQPDSGGDSPRDVVHVHPVSWQ